MIPPDHYVDAMNLGRYVVTVGDLVKVKPSPGRRNGFDGRVRAIRIDPDTDEVIEVTVVGGPTGKPQFFRTYTPDRLAYRRQPKEQK